MPVANGAEEVESRGGMEMLLVVVAVAVDVELRALRGTTARMTSSQPVGAEVKTKLITSSKTQKVAAPLVKLPLTHERVPAAEKTVVIEPTDELAAKIAFAMPGSVEICPSLLNSCWFTMKKSSAEDTEVVITPPAPM